MGGTSDLLQRVLEILGIQIGQVCIGIGTQQAPEILSGGDFIFVGLHVIPQEGEISLIAQDRPQVPMEHRANAVDRVKIIGNASREVDGVVDIAPGQMVVNPGVPPPIQIFGVVAFVEKIKPSLEIITPSFFEKFT